MAEKKKLVSEITSMDVDFAQWYTDIVKKAEMADYSSVKGCIIMRPYAQALWENIQHTLDGMFKETIAEGDPIVIPNRSRECSNADLHSGKPAAEGSRPR